MDERTFDSSHDPGVDDHTATLQAAELAERLLEEISRARHSWAVILAMASALSRLAASMTGASTCGPPPGASTP